MRNILGQALKKEREMRGVSLSKIAKKLEVAVDDSIK